MSLGGEDEQRHSQQDDGKVVNDTFGSLKELELVGTVIIGRRESRQFQLGIESNRSRYQKTV